MDFEIIAQIDMTLIPLAVALYVIGVFLKATPKIADWCIPWILLFVSLLAANVLLGWERCLGYSRGACLWYRGVGESTLQAGAVRNTGKSYEQQKEEINTIWRRAKTVKPGG